MRRLGDTAMTGAERTARWRQRRWAQQRDRMVAMDLADLPSTIDPDQARPLVEAWRDRGLAFGITPAQWMTVPADQLAQPSLVEQLVLALRDAPGLPAPASAVWGAVMSRAQALWRHARYMATVIRQGSYRHPVPHAEQAEPEPRGIEGWRELGRKLFGRDPCGCRCHRDIATVNGCDLCRSKHRNDRVKT